MHPDPTEARPSTSEEAVELYLARRRRGEDVDEKAFAASYPWLAPELESALDALLALERATVPTDATPLPGRIGPFRLIRELGRGGMGVVLEAVEEPLNRRVALKVLPPELVASPSARARFRREAELAARLDHSGIATIYGAGEEAGRHWIAMRYVEGRTLAREIAETRRNAADASCVRLAPAATKGREATLLVASLLAKVARALHSAHEQGVVHRDIKPSNIIVAPDGSPVLLDFGLAIAEEPDGRSLTRTGDAPGTPAYLAPETVGGELARPDAQSDVYGLGVTLYECLALRRPFDAPTPAALYHAILAGAPAGVRSLNPAVPRDLAVVAATAMERDRSRRYRSAQALADDLEACVAGRPIAARPVPLYGRVLRWARREKRLAAAVASAIVIAVGGLSWVSIVQTAAKGAMSAKNEELSAVNAVLATAKATAEANELVAKQKADDVLSLSAIQELKELVEQADALWPALPDKIAGYDDWLARAGVLIEGRPADPERGAASHPGLKDHEAKLAELRLRAKPSSVEKAGYEFVDSRDRWWHAQLEGLVSDLRSLADPGTGLLSEGISGPHGSGIPKRRSEAATIEDRSLSGPEAKQRWGEAIAAIAVSPKYGGLRLTPQIGLLPIGPDPESGLWEFAHLQSGDAAERGAGGMLVVTESMGVVLVLIPGGKFRMGAQSTDPTAPNFDPLAHEDESPVHEVELSPYFLSKYEMTQGQWTRFVGSNPSYYGPGASFDGHPHDLRHPVENVAWTDCTEVFWRLGLSLPTEAQWECGCRAGTDTPWCTGADRGSLRGKVNVADKAFVRAGGPKSIADDWPDLDDGWGVHAPAGTFPPNTFGLHEMHGNVWEWCRDGVGSYGLPPRAGDGERENPGSANRGLRGGAFNAGVATARSTYRYFGTQSYRDDVVGVRPGRALTVP